MQFAKTMGRLASLILVTVFAVAVMLASGTKWFRFQIGPAESAQQQLSRSPVSVKPLEPELVELVERGSGMIRPFERITVSFEIAGRLVSLGQAGGKRPHLDEGDRVVAGQTLATLDRRALQARKLEADARRSQALDEMQRADELKQKNPRAISDAVYLSRKTDLAIAEAQAELAAKSLEDAVLTAPAAGVIAKRFVNPGEAVNPHDPIFEIVQVDQVLLVVGVPESRVRALMEREREIQRKRELAKQGVGAQSPAVSFDPEDLTFRAYVEPVGRSPQGGRWETIEGEVYSISQTADETSGLFEVEILLPNEKGQLRPGQIAVGRIVTDRVHAFRLPIASAVFTDEHSFFYYLRPKETEVRYLFWELGPEIEYEAARHELPTGTFVEQGSDLILFDLPEDRRLAVVRGQHRLVEGRPVTIVGDSGQGEGPAAAASLRTVDAQGQSKQPAAAPHSL